MTKDEMIRTHMGAAGMLMEDIAARVARDPLHPDRPRELRELAGELTTIAAAVDVIRRV